MSESTPPLRCPKCDGRMREVERRGIVIDICGECRGVFLDRGELDTLVEAVEGMNAWYGQQQQNAPGPATQPGSPPAWQGGPPPAGTHPPAGPQTGPPPGQAAQWQGGPSATPPGSWQGQHGPPQGQHGAPQSWQGQHGPPQDWQGQHGPQGKDKKPLEDAVALFRSLAGEQKRHRHAETPRRSHRKGGLADFFDF